MARLLIVILILSFVSGCASDKYVILNYPPESKTGEPSIADATAFPLEPGPEKKIALFQFNDLRSNKSRIGNLRSTSGHDVADIIAENDVTEWVNNAIIMELEYAGYKVIKGEELDNTNNILVLKGGFLLYVVTDLKYDADVSITAELKLDEKVIMRESYNSSVSVGIIWNWPSADNIGESLSLALADAVRQIVHDINAQLLIMSKP